MEFVDAPTFQTSSFMVWWPWKEAPETDGAALLEVEVDFLLASSD